MTTLNSSTLWAETFVAALADAGLRAVCIAPGSRSTPLTIAFTRHQQITAYSLLDERGAAFFGLGLALASERPVALVCTSGTATANFFPAVIEANYAEVPLLLLTTDRPHELRHSGANQTIDQIKLYGNHVRWFVDVGLPETQPPQLVLRSLRSLAHRAMAVALAKPAGPVHLNFPFRKPLEPALTGGDLIELTATAFSSGEENRSQVTATTAHGTRTRFARSTLQPTIEQIDLLVEIIHQSPRGVIVCGPRCPSGGFPPAVTQLARAAGYPILADALSGVRFGPHLNDAKGLILAGYETFWPVDSIEAPQLALRFGSMPISMALGDFLASSALTHHIQISDSPTWQDDTHTTTDFLQVEAATLCHLVAEKLNGATTRPADTRWINALQQAERTTWQITTAIQSDIFFEGTILTDVVALMPPDALLYLASSLPVRHLDQFVPPQPVRLQLFANRGASGIDGTIASALGAAAATDKPLVLVIGDLAFYHDMNSLLALRRCQIKATIVLINNNGGGIFHRLPVARFDPPFTEYFVTPHDLDFEPVVKMFGAVFQKVATRDAFCQAFSAALSSADSHVIEVPTDALLHEQTRRSVVKRVKDESKAKLQITI